jgi:putative Ca2+/H+ antiporter (TMEM165/GDT1 family)
MQKALGLIPELQKEKKKKKEKFKLYNEMSFNISTVFLSFFFSSAGDQTQVSGMVDRTLSPSAQPSVTKYFIFFFIFLYLFIYYM